MAPDAMRTGRGGSSRVAVVLAAMLACAPLAGAKERVGTTVFAQGANTASFEDDIRLMGRGTPIYRHDVLTTGEDSFAIVEFADGTEMILRPHTVFRVDEYADGEGEERMRLHLFQGGVRTVTGEVPRRRPDAFELRTPVATVGVRGTDFSARLCGQDCVEEAGKLGDADGGPDAVGRVAFAKGEVGAVSLFGKQRPLSAGGAVFQGDTLETGPDAFVVVAFRDESRVTVLADSRFRIDRHEYDAQRPGSGSALMRLLRGGIRAAAGLISRARPEAYKVATPVATISTRGTRFDVVCAGTCVDEAGTGRDGLFVLVRLGRVASESSAGTFELGAGATAFIGTAQSAPRFGVSLAPSVEALLRGAPVPEEVEVPPELLQSGSRPVEEGDLAVAVYDGEVTATSATDPEASVELGEGDAGLLGEDGAVRLEEGVPAFVTDDPYNVSPDVEVGEDGTIKEGDLPAADDEDAMSCRM